MQQYLLITECIIEHSNKFLIIERSPNKYAGGLLAFPGGKVEQQDGINNRDILQASAKREVLEEVGIQLTERLTYLTSSYFNGTNNIDVINTVFHCILQTEPIVRIDPKEVTTFFWMTKEEILNATNSPIWLKDYINLL